MKCLQISSVIFLIFVTKTICDVQSSNESSEPIIFYRKNSNESAEQMNSITTKPTLGNQCQVFLDHVEVAYDDFKSKYTSVFNHHQSIECKLVVLKLFKEKSQFLNDFIEKDVRTDVKKFTTILKQIDSDVFLDGKLCNLPEFDICNNGVIPIVGTIVDSIVKYDFRVAAMQYKYLEKSALIPIIEGVYDQGIRIVDHVFIFLDHLQKDEDKIYGYRIIIDELKKYDYLYTTTTMNLAYRVKNAQLLKNLSKESVNSLAYVNDNLPESVKTFPFNSPFHLECKISKTNFLTRSINYDERKYHAVVDRYDNTSRFDWTLSSINNGLTFQIINVVNSELLFVDPLFKYTDVHKRRYALLSMKPERKQFAEWVLEPSPDGWFKIKNANRLHDYLFASPGLKVNNLGGAYTFSTFLDFNRDDFMWSFKPSRIY